MSSALEAREEVVSGEMLLEVEGLTKYFKSDTGLLSGLFGSDLVEAVDDVSFDLQ